MVLWGFRWLRAFVNPYAKDDFGHISEADRRSYILERLEHAQFSEWSWVLVVAGVGFFTDAYSIFAINMVVPMLGIIYYQDNGGVMPHNYETALSVVTLGGSIIGQIAFGLSADIWGRRKMYGLELIITIGATLGVVMSSPGVHGSMNIIVWLLIWRFVLGIGIGADYPLSAVICSEFAPTRWRGKMLTAVFACQPLGQLAAILVALIASANQRNGLPSDATQTNCNEDCMRTLDSVWRWIIGVGVIPAVIALWFRITIIESPRYTADVGRDSRKAASELSRYLLLQAEDATGSGSSFQPLSGGDPEAQLLRRRRASNASSGAVSNADSGAISEVGEEDIQEIRESRGPSPYDGRPFSAGEAHGSRGPSPFDRRPYGDREETLDINGLPIPARSSLNPGGFTNVEIHSLRSTSQPRYSDIPAGEVPIDQDVDGSQLAQAGEIDAPPPPSWKDFKKYFWHDGNFRTLFATSFCWFCLDLPFYGLGMNSPRIIDTIWYGKGDRPTNLYDVLVHNVWQSLVVVSLGAFVGVAITFVAIDKLGRRNIQLIGFFWLFILFVVIGGSFSHLYDIGGNAAIIVLYILCQIFFNFGPNVTTYIIPAELFPTRYRALSHGISAAAGKFGSVIAQVFLAYVNYGTGADGKPINYSYNISKWLPYSLLILAIFMLLGLLTTFWIPANELGVSGTTKTLEEWEVGRETPNGFAETRAARIVASCWRALVWVWDGIYMAFDALAGGEEKERRREQRERATEMEMNNLENAALAAEAAAIAAGEREGGYEGPHLRISGGAGERRGVEGRGGLFPHDVSDAGAGDSAIDVEHSSRDLLRDGYSGRGGVGV